MIILEITKKQGFTSTPKNTFLENRGGQFDPQAFLGLINNSGLSFICFKIMNAFTCGEEISKLAV